MCDDGDFSEVFFSPSFSVLRLVKPLRKSPAVEGFQRACNHGSDCAVPTRRIHCGAARVLQRSDNPWAFSQSMMLKVIS